MSSFRVDTQSPYDSLLYSQYFDTEDEARQYAAEVENQGYTASILYRDANGDYGFLPLLPLLGVGVGVAGTAYVGNQFYDALYEFYPYRWHVVGLIGIAALFPLLAQIKKLQERKEEEE